MTVTGFSKTHAFLVSAGWKWRGERMRGCIREISWQDPRSGALFLQCHALAVARSQVRHRKLFGPDKSQGGATPGRRKIDNPEAATDE
jgi:hypothetical protein